MVDRMIRKLAAQRPPRTLLELALARAGFKRAMQVVTFAVAWGIAEVHYGRRPSVEDYAAYWRSNVVTAYREQQRWREIFPEWSTPTAFFDAVGMDLSARAQIAPNGALVPTGVV